MIATAGATQVTLGNQTFINHGLQAHGPHRRRHEGFSTATPHRRLLEFGYRPRRSWHKNADGSYGGTLLALPDLRAANLIGDAGLRRLRRTSQHCSILRFHALSRPAAPLSAGGRRLKDSDRHSRTHGGDRIQGLSPATSPPASIRRRAPPAIAITQNGVQLPGTDAGGAAAGKISPATPKRLRLLADGSFYVSRRIRTPATSRTSMPQAPRGA